MASHIPPDDQLAAKCEEAIDIGRKLLIYSQSVVERVRMFPLGSMRSQVRGYQQRGFFDRWRTNEHIHTIMGCHQTVMWPRQPGSFSISAAREFVFRDFLRKSSWRYANGRLGGFEVHLILSKGQAGGIVSWEDDGGRGALDWRELGGDTLWSMIRIDLHDLGLVFGPFRQRFAVYVVQHPDFVSERPNPDPYTELQLRIAYPFVSAAPIPSFLAFGPGKFKSALKTYDFYFRKDGTIEVYMLFIISPRSVKLTTLPGPDPLYASARLIERMSFGTIPPEYFKSMIEAAMLTRHCFVHKLVVDHAREVFYGGKHATREG